MKTITYFLLIALLSGCGVLFGSSTPKDSFPAVENCLELAIRCSNDTLQPGKEFLFTVEFRNRVDTAVTFLPEVILFMTTDSIPPSYWEKRSHWENGYYLSDVLTAFRYTIQLAPNEVYQKRYVIPAEAIIYTLKLKRGTNRLRLFYHYQPAGFYFEIRQQFPSGVLQKAFEVWVKE